MANWARGLAAGLESGYKLGEVLRQKQIRDAMTDARTQAESGGYNRFSQQDINKLNEYATAVDPEGRRMFDLTIEPGTTTYVPRRIVYGNESPQIEGYSPAWLGRETGLAPQQGADVSASPVPMDFLPAEQRLLDVTGGEPYFPGAMNSLDEPGVRVGKEGLRPSVGNYPSMGTEAASIAPQAYEGLTTSAPEYSPDLRISRPDGSAAYRSLTRETVPEAGLGPTRTVFMGKEYEAGTLTKEMRDAALMDRYASILERAGEPDRAMQMRASAMGLRKGTLELQDLEATAEKKKSLRDIQAGMSSWFKQRVGDRQPTADDYEAFDTKVISDLMAGGHVDEANAAFDRRNKVIMDRMKMEEAARGQAINEAVFALSSGELKPTVDLYNRFVHDGAKVTNVVRNEKDGSVTVKRQAADGTDLPDYKFGSLDELSASLRSLTDPGAFAAYTQNSFMNNIRTKTLAVEERRAGAYERRADAAERRAARADVVYLTDGKQVYEYRRDSLPYDKAGKLQLPEGLSLYKGQGQLTQGSLTPEQERTLADIRRDDNHKRDMEIIVRGKNPEQVAAAKERVRKRLETGGVPADAIKFDDRDLAPMP